MRNDKSRALLFLLLLSLYACSNGQSGQNMGGFHSVESFPDAIALGAVWSFGPENVWVSADSGQMFQFDGNSWTTHQLETLEMMRGIWGFSPNNVWAVGGQTLALYDGKTWATIALNTLAPGIEGLNAIWASSLSDVWVVGSQSTAAHFDGDGWRRYLAAGPENTVVWGAGPGDVYTASVFEVAHWNGSEWTSIETGGWSSGGEGIWGFGPNNIWICNGDEFAHFDGVSWEVTELDFVGDASKLWGTGPSDLWGVGTFGSIIHYDGNEWNELARQAIGSPYLRTFHDIHGSENGDLWIIGSQMGAGGVLPLIFRRLP